MFIDKNKKKYELVSLVTADSKNVIKNIPYWTIVKDINKNKTKNLIFLIMAAVHLTSDGNRVAN